MVGAAFLPVDYEGELFVDWVALRDCGLLDRVLRLPTMEDVFDVIAGEHCCELDDLCRLRTVFVDHDGKQRSVSIAELAAGAARKQPPQDWVPASLGAHAGYRRGKDDRAMLTFWPAPELAVDGPPELLAAMLERGNTLGRPHQDLAAMLAGDRVLAQFAYGRFGRPFDETLRTFGALFGDREDPADFVRLRLWQAADDSLVFAVTMRFQNGTSGLRGTEQFVRERLDAMLRSKQMAPLKKVLGAIVVSHQERDLSVSLVLGSPSDAIAKVESLVVAMMAMPQGPFLMDLDEAEKK